MSERKFKTLVVGAGPAGIGSAVAGEAQGLLPDALRGQGVGLVDSGPEGDLGKGRLNTFVLPSNSPATDFHSRVDPHGYYGDVLQGRNAKRLVRAGYATVPLKVAASFLGDLGGRTAEVFREHGSEVFPNTHITRIDQGRDDQGLVYRLTGKNTLTKEDEVLTGERLLLATGAAENPWNKLEDYGSLVLSGAVIDETGMDEVLDSTGDIVVLGANHSGLSVVQKVLVALEAAGDDRRVRLLYRTPPRPFYPNSAAALDAGYNFGPADIDKRTKRINVNGGVRGEAMELLERIHSGDEPRVEMQQIGGLEEAADILATAGARVQAIGWQANAIPIYSGNRIIGPALNGRGHIVVDAQTRVYGYNEKPLDQIFAIGHGHGAVPELTGGEKSHEGYVATVVSFHERVGAEAASHALAA